MKTKFSYIALAGVLAAGSLFGMAGCSNDKLGKKMFSFGDDYYKSVSKRYTLNYDEMIYDDFTGDTIDKNKWVISDSVWDQWGTDQNGVRPQNIFLVDDPANPETHLIMRANGSYYSGEALSSTVDGYNTGAGLSTVEALGPGRYEVKMKACPRIGALTSMWVFSWFNQDDGSIQQNEIDIEIGLEPEFQKVYFTTWTGPDNNSNYGHETDFAVNDGDWHIYSFDWVTDAEVPYVDYFIDGQFVYRSDSNVPTTNATLTLGIWVPAWAGGGSTDTVYNISNNSRMFDQDYAQFSWWRYIPFDMGGWEQRPVTNRNYDLSYYDKVETLTSLPVVNKCANGDFERADETYYTYLREVCATLEKEVPVLEDRLKTLESELENMADGEEKQKKQEEYDTIKEEFDPKEASLAELKQMLIDDPAPWKNYTITDEDDEFFVPGSKVERVLDDGDQGYCMMIQNGGSLGQWLLGAHEGFRYKLTLKYKTEGDAKAAFLFTCYNGYSTNSLLLDTETIEIGSSAEWKEFTIEFTVGEEDAQSICYNLEALNGKGTVYFDDISLIYLGH